ncbi:31936_t:CDS:1, partial [Racocetra persica]
TGDIPAITKVLNLPGHNSYMACYFCNIHSIYNNHIYYLLNSNLRSSSHDLINLSMRSYEEYNKDVITIKQLQFESDKNRQINLR